jgi:hypothetical protein
LIDILRRHMNACQISMPWGLEWPFYLVSLYL